MAATSRAISLCLLVGFPVLSFAQPQFELAVEDRTLAISAGSVEAAFETIVSLELVSPAQHGTAGFSFGLQHDPAVVQADQVHQSGFLMTIWGGFPPSFYSANILPDGVTLGVVIGFFDHHAIYHLQAGNEYDLVSIQYSVDPGVIGLGLPTSTALDFVDLLGTPPVDTLVIGESGLSWTPSKVPASVDISFEDVEYRRGDANVDGVVNLADVIYLLSSLFGSSSISCQDAADTNADSAINVADTVTLLGALFGAPTVPLAPPYPNCGIAHLLGCTLTPCP